MIRIALVGDIGSGKSYIAKKFGYPVFNADFEVSKLYKNNKNIANKKFIMSKLEGLKDLIVNPSLWNNQASSCCEFVTQPDHVLSFE